MDRVKQYELPPDIRTLTDQYEQFGDRNQFLWKWVHSLVPAFTFSSVNPRYQSNVQNLKTVATLFTTLLDDCIEKRKDRRTFKELSKIPARHRTPNMQADKIDTEYVSFALTVWQRIEQALHNSPRREAFEELLYYDIRQMINAIEYTRIVNRDIWAATFAELETYESHNMMMFVYADIDLMYSPAFDRTELALVRTAVNHAQMMARIGNWVSTWERELREGDYSSGVILHSIENNVISRKDVEEAMNDRADRGMQRLVEQVRASDTERRLLQKWHRHHSRIERTIEKIETIDMTQYLTGMEQVLRYHFASKGMK